MGRDGKEQREKEGRGEGPSGELARTANSLFSYQKNPEAGRGDCLLRLDPVEPFLIRTEAESAVTSYPTNRFLHEQKARNQVP